jgi:secreted trypsin-like serine protease
MARILRAAAVVAAVATMGAAVAGAITNGQPDGNGHPFVAALVDDYLTPGYYQRFCTGTLVAPRIVVTAAHCLLGPVDTEVWVSFDSVYVPGVSSLIHGTGIAAVDPAIFHGESGAGARYGNSAMGDDIAVVHLDQTAPVDQFAQLPTAGLLSTLDLRGRTFTAVGYGRTRADKTEGPNNILPNFDPDVRNVSIEGFRSLQAGALTLSGNPATGDGSICNGDSGGPHFLDNSNVMVAITIEADIACRSLSRTYRLDIPFARQFLASQGVVVP